MSKHACAILSMPTPAEKQWSTPDDAQVEALWDAFCMPEHIRRHSRAVASMAEALSHEALRAGLESAREVYLPEVRASALLHDLAKAYTIAHGGNHSQIGAAWVAELTGNPRIAQGVLHHVNWPFDLDLRRHFLPLAVAYADKRARHDELVTVPERFADLYDRYGTTQRARDLIQRSLDQALEMERLFSELLGVDLNACTVDSGRLVQRA